MIELGFLRYLWVPKTMYLILKPCGLSDAAAIVHQNLDVKIKKGRGSGTEKEKEWTKVSRGCLGLGVGVNKVRKWVDMSRRTEKNMFSCFFSNVEFGYDSREGK